MNNIRKEISKYLISVICLMSFFSSLACASGGISLLGTRIIYPSDQLEKTITVNNSSETDSFLVQSWVETEDGKKSSNFVAVPPLYLSKPGDENKLRVMRIRKDFPTDRESLYYFVAKAIPSVDPSQVAGKSSLLISAATRIKVFLRPASLKPGPEQAVKMITARRQGAKIFLKNPASYYITVIHLSYGNSHPKDIMLAPFSTSDVSKYIAGAQTLSFDVINDFGGLIKENIIKIN